MKYPSPTMKLIERIDEMDSPVAKVAAFIIGGPICLVLEYFVLAGFVVLAILTLGMIFRN